MHNLVAFYAAVPINAALTNLTPVTDPLTTVTSNARLIFPEDYYVRAMHALVNAGTRARLNTPSMRVIALPEIFPFKVTAGAGTNPPLMLPDEGAIRVPRNDEVGIDVSRAGAGTNDCFAALWVAPRTAPAPDGPTYTMRCTAAPTLTVGTWVLAALTFDQVLPYGRYAVIGMHVNVAAGMYARLVFPGATQYRPGVPANVTYGDYINPQVMRFGNFGLFGYFDSTAQPQVEILGDTAGAQSATILLDLVKVN